MASSLEGSSAVDESMLTGEPMPQTKEANAAVTGGTVNGNGTFLMRAERVGANTLLSQIVEMTAKAQAQPCAGAAAGGSCLGVVCAGGGAHRGADLFAVVAVWPAALVRVCRGECGGRFDHRLPLCARFGDADGRHRRAGRGAQLGVLIKNAETLERLQQIDTLMLDKTGTLTEGKPTVVEIFPLPGLSARDLLACAAAVEAASEHPLATAIVNAAKERNIPLATVTDFQAVPAAVCSGNVGESEVFVGQAAFLKKNGVFLDAECHTRSDAVAGGGLHRGHRRAQ
jgi:Cu+-exporting ATPase